MLLRRENEIEAKDRSNYTKILPNFFFLYAQTKSVFRSSAKKI